MQPSNGHNFEKIMALHNRIANRIASCVRSERLNGIEQLNEPALAQMIEGACGVRIGKFGGSMKKAIAYCAEQGYTLHPSLMANAATKRCPYNPAIITNANKKIDSWGYQDDAGCALSLLTEHHFLKNKCYKFGQDRSAEILSGNQTASDIYRQMSTVIKRLISTQQNRGARRRRDVTDPTSGAAITENTWGGSGAGDRKPGISGDPLKAIAEAMYNPKLRKQLFRYWRSEGMKPEWENEIEVWFSHGKIMPAARELGVEYEALKARVRNKYAPLIKDSLTKLIEGGAGRQWTELGNTIMTRMASANFQKELDKAIKTNEKILASGQIDDKWKKTLKAHIDNLKAMKTSATNNSPLISADTFAKLLS